MTPERLAEIRKDDACYIGQMAPVTAEGQRRELLAEVQRLTDELDCAGSSSDRAWTREHDLLQEVQQLRTNPAPRVWIVDCVNLDNFSVHTTDAVARAAAEAYVHDQAERQPVTDFDWRIVSADDDTHELWGSWRGRMYPANILVYSLPVLAAEGTAS